MISKRPRSNHFPLRATGRPVALIGVAYDATLDNVIFAAMISGCIPLDLITDLARLPAHLATCLQGVSARSVQITGHQVSLKGGILRMVDNWNLLVPFGSGAVSVDPIHRRLCYQLDARQLLVFASALPVLLVFVAVANGGSAEMLLAALVIWLWLVGGNLLIGIPRFRRFLRKTLTSAPANQIV